MNHRGGRTPQASWLERERPDRTQRARLFKPSLVLRLSSTRRPRRCSRVIVRRGQADDVRPHVFVIEAVGAEGERSARGLLLLGSGEGPPVRVQATLGPIIPTQVCAGEHESTYARWCGH